MHIVRQAVARPAPGLTRVELRVSRLTLAKTRWRGRAADGAEFGFDLPHPLQHGSVILEDAGRAYVLCQEEESALEVDLDAGAAEAAKLGWALGNLHQSIDVQGGVLRAADDSAVRALLQAMGVPFRAVRVVFRPGPTAGSGHHHDHHA